MNTETTTPTAETPASDSVAGNKADEAKAAPATYQPNDEALAGVFATDSFANLVSCEGEERLIKIPFGADHFFKLIDKIDVLVKIDACFAHLGIKPSKGLQALRPSSFKPLDGTNGKNNQVLHGASWLVSIAPVNDLKAYALKMVDVALYRLKAFYQAKAFDNSLTLMGSFVVKTTADGKTILDVVEGFDARIVQFEPSDFPRTMVMANLLGLLHNARRRVDSKLGQLLISGCEAPSSCWITDVRQAMQSIGGDSEDQTRRVIKIVEGKLSGSLDVIFFTLDANEKVLDYKRFDSLLPYTHDAAASLVHAFIIKSAPVDEIYERMKETTVIAPVGA